MHHPHFGLLLVSCEKADLRPSPDGVLVYDENGVHELIAPPARTYPNKDGVIDELYDAIASGEPPLHDGRWGTATTVPPPSPCSRARANGALSRLPTRTVHMLTAEENALLTNVTGNAPMGQMMRATGCRRASRRKLRNAIARRIARRSSAIVSSCFAIATANWASSTSAARTVSPRSRSDATKRADCAASIMAGNSTPPARASTCRANPASTASAIAMKLKSYPVHEAGGMVWTYLGPAGTEPRFPEYDWMKLPREQFATVKVGETRQLRAGDRRRDRLIAFHGSCIRASIWDWKKRAEISMDTSPKMECEDTNYGFRYAAIRKPTKNPDTEKYVRVTIFLVPFTAFIRARSKSSRTATSNSSCRSTTNARSSTASSSVKITRRSTKPKRGANITSCRASISIATGISSRTKTTGSTRPRSDEERQLHRHQRLLKSRHGLPRIDGAHRRPYARASRHIRHRNHPHAQTHARCRPPLPRRPTPHRPRPQPSPTTKSAPNSSSSQSTNPGKP